MKKFSREEVEQCAQSIATVDPDKEEHSFYPRLGQAAAQQRVKGEADLTAVIEWHNLKVVTPATGSAASLPSLPNILLGWIKVRSCTTATYYHAPPLCFTL